MKLRIASYLTILALASALLGAVSITAARAQEGPPCAKTEALIKSLRENYNEVEVGGGIINERAVMLTFASPEGATWTVLAAGADGMACVVATGEHWFLGALPKAGDPA